MVTLCISEEEDWGSAHSRPSPVWCPTAECSGSRTRDKGGESEHTLPPPEANPTLSFVRLSPPGKVSLPPAWCSGEEQV